jgi:hypothetical protein
VSEGCGQFQAVPGIFIPIFLVMGRPIMRSPASSATFPFVHSDYKNFGKQYSDKSFYPPKTVALSWAGNIHLNSPAGWRHSLKRVHPQDLTRAWLKICLMPRKRLKTEPYHQVEWPSIPF